MNDVGFRKTPVARPPLPAMGVTRRDGSDAEVSAAPTRAGAYPLASRNRPSTVPDKSYSIAATIARLTTAQGDASAGVPGWQFHPENVPEQPRLEVYFPDEPPTYSANPRQLRFAVIVGGKRIVCAIAGEALFDHFEAMDDDETSLRRAFALGRHRIFSLCSVAVEQSRGYPVVLRSGLFRFANAASMAANAI